ncbi:OLC1v1033193C1 [Oldenlandia corymbosa var. corymbosa]|uniref:OLC1v1033193C1 n=1 Tax=Oldenlandia corymbosa var. corymbosa TaxID=529605 RepID=A0AAV1CMS8_OLDCO|nr:OLC1v1033193C1 [Oldenlandia corymbosa var. corymbosa]
MDLSTRGEENETQDHHQPSSEKSRLNDGMDSDGATGAELVSGKDQGIKNGFSSEEKADDSNLNSDDHAGKHIEDVVKYNDAVSSVETVQQPHAHLPKPEAPPGVINDVTCASPPSPRDFSRSQSSPAEIRDFEIPAIGKFFREKSNSLSSAITRRISSLKDNKTTSPGALMASEAAGGGKWKSYVTEINLSGLKVVVNLKPTAEKEKRLLGRISFFSRSNCRDCGAVRTFLRERNLNFVEINVDVYPSREKELIERTGNATVPKIFFNEKLIGGLVALNSLRNSGVLDAKLEEMLAGKCPPEAPEPPVYGFDDDDVAAAGDEEADEMLNIVRVLRQRLPIQDRLMKMKIVKNCFAGRELVEILIHHLDCGRSKAVEIGKQLARKHFIHHVFGENEFEDGNHFYRFLEHEPFILKCYNFRGATNDTEPKAAALLNLRLMRIMSAILEAYASDDHKHLDYVKISKSEEFRRYIHVVQDLQRVNIFNLSAEEKLSFFLNIYNAMAIHAVIRIGHPGGIIDRRSFFSDFIYVIGGYPFSLTAIRNGILRSNRRAPFSLVKPFSGGDKRLQLALPKVNQLSHFGLCNGTRSSPAVKFFTPQGVESELRSAAREFFIRDDAMQVDLSKRTVYLTRIISWYSADFGQEKEILKWMISYLDATKAGLLTHLLSDGGPVNIVYHGYDWSLNS